MLFAQALLCHHAPEPGAACGACKSCRWIAARKGLVCEHPDLLLPMESTKSQTALSGPERAGIHALGRQDDHQEVAPVRDHAALIPLEAVRNLAVSLQRSPQAGARRVAVVPEAQRMCAGQAEAANAFLKTLEEPPPSVVVILTSSRPQALLETIVSRLQQVRFQRLSGAEIRRGLASGGAHEPKDLDLAIALADGSLGRAKEILGGELGRWRHGVMHALDAFGPHSCPGFGLALWALAVAEGEKLFHADEETGSASSAESGGGGEEDEGAAAETKTAAACVRHVFRRLLELLEVAFRDGLVYAAGGETVGLLQPDHAALARKLASRFGVEGCERVLSGFREAHLALRLYVNGALVSRVLAGRMVEALQKY